MTTQHYYSNKNNNNNCFSTLTKTGKGWDPDFLKKKIYLVTNSLFSRKTLSFFVSVSLVRSKSEGTKKNLQKIRVLLLTSHLVSILAVIDPQKILTEIRTGNFFCWVTSRTIYGPFYYVHLIRTEESKNQSIFKRSYYAIPKWPFFKMVGYQNRQFSNFFLWKFHGLVLGLVGLIDAKNIDVAQPIWSWDCPTWAQKQAKQAKNAFFVFLDCF